MRQQLPRRDEGSIATRLDRQAAPNLPFLGGKGEEAKADANQDQEQGSVGL